MIEDLGAQWIAAMRGSDFTRAWDVSDRVLAVRDRATRDDPTLPYHRRWVWDGRALDGRDVLVRCYHGLGDTIQYARHLPALASRARTLTVEAQPRLCGLLSGIAGVDRLVPFDVDRPTRSDRDIEITELPHALRAVPASAPYLRADAAPLPAGTIGVCHTAGDWDPARCVAPALLAPLCAGRPAITLVSEASDLAVLNPQGCPFDIDATAALVAGCDLVVTVDTMIAHLAGALGRPTWLLLKSEPDWRWTPGARTTPWYPTMRLYPQPTPGDWASVIHEVAHDLDRRYAKGDRVRESP